MQICRILCRSAEFCTDLRGSVQICRILCRSAQNCGILCSSAKFCGNLTQNCRVLCRSAEFCADLRSSAKFCAVLQRYLQFCADLRRSCRSAQILQICTELETQCTSKLLIIKKNPAIPGVHAKLILGIVGEQSRSINAHGAAICSRANKRGRRYAARPPRRYFSQ